MSRLVTSDSAPARNTEIATGAVAAGLNLASRAPDGAGRVLARALKRVARSPQQRMLAEWVQEYLAPGGPGAAYVKRLTRQVNPKVRRRFIAGFIASLFFRNPEVSAELKRTHGISAPSLLAISPSMRCNLRCTGCYAGNYSRKDDLPVETVDRVLKEAESIGTRTFIIIGGEPFMWRPLLDLIQDHTNSFFQVFTKPILVADFWNDGAVTGGCLAGGRKYLHINNEGDVEPCVFCHFAVDNIKDTSLLNALTSDFFRGIRDLQPFGHNLLRPCPLRHRRYPGLQWRSRLPSNHCLPAPRLRRQGF